MGVPPSPILVGDGVVLSAVPTLLGTCAYHSRGTLRTIEQTVSLKVIVRNE